jgi:hypothetical protein
MVDEHERLGASVVAVVAETLKIQSKRGVLA